MNREQPNATAGTDTTMTQQAADSRPPVACREQPLILVVDDAAELGAIVNLLGRRAGHEVVLCADAPAGWEFLRQRQPDLVLVDHNLPGVSGLELCRMIRATPALAALPLALFGHWHLSHDLLTGLQCGVDFMVSKDLITDPEVWQTRLREILGWIFWPALGASGIMVGRGPSPGVAGDLGRRAQPRFASCLAETTASTHFAISALAKSASGAILPLRRCGVGVVDGG